MVKNIFLDFFTVDDLSLFNGLKNGDSQAINKIYQGICPKVIAWVKSNSGTEDDGYDLFQETLEVILLKIKSLDSNLSGLIMRIAQRRWIDKLRGQKKMRIVSMDQSIEKLDDEEKLALVEYEKHKLMDQTFEKLSELCQKIITKLKEGQSVENIVQSLELSSANTLYRRKSACIERWSLLIKQQNKYKELFH